MVYYSCFEYDEAEAAGLERHSWFQMGCPLQNHLGLCFQPPSILCCKEEVPHLHLRVEVRFREGWDWGGEKQMKWASLTPSAPNDRSFSVELLNVDFIS